MSMKDTFSGLHPVTGLVYFAFVIGFTMFTMNPVCLAVSLICALLNALYLSGGKAVRLCLVYILPMIVLVALINPVFNHRGTVVLSYFAWGNPLTLESIIYGIAAAALLASTILWFSCFNSVMTSDKLMYLFGRILPSMSLVISMTLRFAPRFSSQLKKVSAARKSIVGDATDKRLLIRIKNAVKTFSVMISLSLENSIDTADSMKSRGYGLKGRTSYSIFHFDKRNALVLTVILILGIISFALLVTDCTEFRYFPSISGNLFSPEALVLYVTYCVLMLLPLIMSVGEGARWKFSRSKI